MQFILPNVVTAFGFLESGSLKYLSLNLLIML